MRLGMHARKFTLYAAAALFMMALPGTAHAKKVALIIGISDYQTMRSAEDTSSNLVTGDLKSSADDAKEFQSLLVKRFGFRKEDTMILTNDQASKKNIVDAMTNWLPRAVGSDDEVVLYISGHGTQVLSKGNDPNELWDQAFVCYDYHPVSTVAEANPANRNIILDNDFGRLFAKLAEKTDRIIFIADCCYSGTISRDPMLTNLSYGKWIPPTKADLKKAKSISKSDNIMDIVDDNVTLIAACADAEKANEAEMEDGKWHGVMTYHLMQVMSGCDSSMTYSQMIKEIKERVQSKFRQTPQLVSRYPGRTVFGGVTGGIAAQISAPTAQAPTTTAPVQPTNNATVTTSSSATATTENGSATVSSTTTVTVPTVDPVSSNTLYVRVLGDNADLVGQVESALVGIQGVQTTQVMRNADRFLTVSKNGYGGVKGDLTLRDAVVESSAKSNSADQLVTDLRPFLLKALLVKVISAVRSTDPSLAPKLNIAYELPKNISVKPVEPENPGLPRLYVNSNVTFEVVPSRACYITLIDIGTDGTTAVLLPNNIYPSQKRLDAGTAYRMPDKDMGFQLVVEAPSGTEMVVAIATTEPIDWSGIDMKVDGSRAGIGIVDTMLASRIFKPISVTTTTTASVGVGQGILPHSGFGVSFVLADVRSAR